MTECLFEVTSAVWPGLCIEIL